MEDSGDHFRAFAASLGRRIESYGETDESVYDRQKRQINTLISLEAQFRKTLVEHKWGYGVYEDFITFIKETKRNILSARPYFRERQATFTKRISKALKKGDIKTLQKFRFNYSFILFVLSARKWFPKSPIRLITKKIEDLRNEIVELNMPLAINRAKIFWSRTPKSHLEYMEFINIASEGLLAAVDKFVPPFGKVWRAVAIGRMTGNFIEEYSETSLHFFPSDKRKLYRANKLIRKFEEDVDYTKLASDINKTAEVVRYKNNETDETITKKQWGELSEDEQKSYVPVISDEQKTNPDEIADLMAAASTVSLTSVKNDEGYSVNKHPVPVEQQPDMQLEIADTQRALYEAISKLTVFEQKILKLKGLDF